VLARNRLEIYGRSLEYLRPISKDCIRLAASESHIRSSYRSSFLFAEESARAGVPAVTHLLFTAASSYTGYTARDVAEKIDW